MPIDLVVGLLMAVTAFGQLALVAEDLGGGSSSSSSSQAGPSGRDLKSSKEAQRRSRARRQHAAKFDPAVPYEPRHHHYPTSLSQGCPTPSSGSAGSNRSSSCGSFGSSSSDSSERSLSLSAPRSILKRRDPVHVHMPLPSSMPSRKEGLNGYHSGLGDGGRRKSDPSVAVDGLSVGRDSHRGLGLATGTGKEKRGRRRVAFEEGLPS